MAKCSYCLCSMEETAGSIVPSNAVEVAIQNGYSPTISPSWETMKQTASRTIKDYETEVTDAMLVDIWKRQLTVPNRRWRICDNCFKSLLSYLPKSPNAVPPKSQDQSQFPNHPTSGSSNDEAIGWLVPIHTSIWAIFASYAGLLSLALFPAPIALILGIIAHIDIKKHPEKKGFGRAIFAIIMGSIFTLLLAILLISIALG